MAMLMPLLLLMVLGVVEISYALLDQHVVAKLSREGSNLISRDTTLLDSATALRSMSQAPVNFTSGRSTVIFSVIRRGSTTGTANYDKDILYQRYVYGTFSATSTLATRGTGSYGGAPNFEANNADSDSNLQITNLPTNFQTIGGMTYVTEIFTNHTLLTPLDRFGVTVPNRLYSIAYF